MQIQQSSRDGVAIVSPRGRIDTTTSGAVEDTIRHLVDGGARNLIVDLSGVEYISSAGLRVFLVLAKRMRDLRGKLVLSGMTEPVRQVFQLAGFMALFLVEPTQDSAFATFTRA
ncbi:MAG TPA: STAS domain-containing protein [Vicinamibacterales bacterium]|jgi:anti-anti-sigma factor|nr:STAS domain-containing protein [Vicinamibacterales bacterium]